MWVIQLSGSQQLLFRHDSQLTLPQKGINNWIMASMSPLVVPYSGLHTGFFFWGEGGQGRRRGGGETIDFNDILKVFKERKSQNILL